MLIEFEFWGGFAGLQKQKCLVDTKTLDSQKAHELTTLINNSDVLNFDQNKAQSPQIPDVFYYKLSISTENIEKKISFNDVDVSPSLNPLLTYLRKLTFELKRKESHFPKH